MVLQAVYRYECQEGQEHVIEGLSAEEIGVMRNVLLGDFRLLLSRSTVLPYAHCLAIHGFVPHGSIISACSQKMA